MSHPSSGGSSLYQRAAQQWPSGQTQGHKSSRQHQRIPRGLQPVNPAVQLLAHEAAAYRSGARLDLLDQHSRCLVTAHHEHLGDQGQTRSPAPHTARSRMRAVSSTARPQAPPSLQASPPGAIPPPPPPLPDTDLDFSSLQRDKSGVQEVQPVPNTISRQRSSTVYLAAGGAAVSEGTVMTSRPSKASGTHGSRRHQHAPPEPGPKLSLPDLTQAFETWSSNRHPCFTALHEQVRTYGFLSMYADDVPSAILPVSIHKPLAQLVLPLPPGWNGYLDPTGFLIYVHESSGFVTLLHPGDQAPAAALMPVGWLFAYDLINDRPFFCNVLSGHRQWNAPVPERASLERPERPPATDDLDYALSVTDPGYDRSHPPQYSLTSDMRMLYINSLVRLSAEVELPFGTYSSLEEITNGLLALDASTLVLRRIALAADTTSVVAHAAALWLKSDFLTFVPLSAGIVSFAPAGAVNAGLRSIEALGRLAGLCSTSQIPLPLVFARNIAKHLVGRSLSVQDFRLAYPRLYQRLRQLLSRPQDLMRTQHTYTVILPEYGIAPLDIRADGSTILVRQKNMVRYIRDVMYFALRGAVKHQLQAFRRGYTAVMPPDLLIGLDLISWQLMVNGIPSIDASELPLILDLEPPLVPGIPPVRFLILEIRKLHPFARAQFWGALTGSLFVPTGGIKTYTRFFHKCTVAIAPIRLCVPPTIIMTRPAIFINVGWASSARNVREAIRSIIQQGSPEESIHQFFEFFKHLQNKSAHRK